MSRNNKLSFQPANDDTVQCLFFSSKLGTDLRLWEDLCKHINNYIKTLTEDYIWHREEFQVYVPIITDNSDEEIPMHLRSTTCFGDNLEDEWFIVYVVLEISKKFKDIIIQLKDSDGDFLLIEAADYLQSWANPENTENRVFIYDFHIHIISPEVAVLETKMRLKEALRIINESPELTRAPHDIQQAILNRIGRYPLKISDHIHKALVKLPSDLATLLTIKPSLIAPIVDAYCHHDIIDARSLKNVKFDDCIVVEVKFTKFLFAKLLHSKLINYANNYIARETDKRSILGFKLLCGFQMIMNKASVNDLYSSKEYHRFINSLKQSGYFRNNIEGSKEYNHLLQEAQNYFSTVECPENSNVSLNISELMTSSDFTRVKNRLMCTATEQLGYVEENEDWLNMHPEQLNELLHTRYGKKSKFKNNDVISSQTITEELSSFLKETSDFEGIEPNRLEESENNNIDFESNKFISSIEKMLKIISTGGNKDTESNDSDDFDDMFYNENDDSNDDDNIDCEAELKSKLQDYPTELVKDRTVLANIIQSMKEEKASTGPSSNLMRSIGVSKNELLDSDDD